MLMLAAVAGGHIANLDIGKSAWVVAVKSPQH
jgi:hypothetical protein